MDDSRTRLSTWISSLALAIAIGTAAIVWFRSGDLGPAPATSRGTLARVRTTKLLSAGYVVNIHQVNRDPQTGQMSGYHYDLMTRIAQNAGFEINWIETNFGTMVAGLNTGQFDIVVGGGYESIARAKDVTFTDPLMYSPLGYVARADDGRFRSEADLHRPGIRVAVTAGGASADYVQMFLTRAEPILLTRNELARVVLEVTSGRADVGIGNLANCLLFERDHPNVKCVTKGRPFFLFSSAFVIRQGDYDWLHFLNSSIRQLQVNGFAQQLETRYNPAGAYWVPVTRP